MATVTGFTAARMAAIEASTVVSGFVDPQGRLLLQTRDESQIDAGSVVGPQGPTGVGPTGTVSMFAGAAAPTGHLLCDGSAVSRTGYASLFAVIGTLYGAGDGVNTFNLPNLKGRVPVGRDAAQTEFDVIGESGGAKSQIMSPSEMPVHTHVQNAHTHVQTAHSHSITDPGHFHFQTYNTGAIAAAGGTSVGGMTGSGGTGFAWAQQTTENKATGISINNATPTNQNTTATNQNAGGGLAQNNMQPYLVMNYIIKT